MIIIPWRTPNPAKKQSNKKKFLERNGLGTLDPETETVRLDEPEKIKGIYEKWLAGITQRIAAECCSPGRAGYMLEKLDEYEALFYCFGNAEGSADFVYRMTDGLLPRTLYLGQVFDYH